MDRNQDNSAALGLSSQKAQERLLTQLHAYAISCCRVNWSREVIRSPYALISSVLTIIAALFLIVEFFVSGRNDATVVLQAAILLLFVVVNVVLFVWEMYVLKTRRIRRLLSHIKPLLRTNCPWSACSYPKSPISTLRGNFTVLAYRDQACVNLPTSLLVEGDVIELHPEVPSPAKVSLLDMDSSQSHNELILELGHLPPSDVFANVTVPGGNDVSFIPDSAPPKWTVLETPIISLLTTNVAKHRSKTVLTKERNRIMATMELLTVIIYLVSLLYNFIRYYSLTSDFEDSWPEMLLRQPVYTVLPILLVPLPVVWTVVNLYGTAIVTLLIESEPTFTSNKRTDRMKKVLITLSRMSKLLWYHAIYPNYRAFHILGSLTSLCAVDKENLLTGGFPTPEKVLVLRTEDLEEAERAQLDKMESAEDQREELQASLKDAVKVTITAPDSKAESTQPSSLQHSQDRMEVTNPLAVKIDIEDSTATQTLNVQLKTLDSVSTYSDFSPIQVIKEILDISPSFEPGSGICFDDVNWKTYLGSLKPVGVNLLTTAHLTKQTSNWQLPSISSKLIRLVDQTSCACSLGLEIGVSDYASSLFEKKVYLYSFGESPPLSAHSLNESSAVTMSNLSAIQPHIVSLVLKPVNSSNHLLMSRGSGDMVISCCSDFWDGRDLQPMTDVERTTILEFYTRRSNTGYCIALAYNPLLSSNSIPEKSIGMFVPASEMSRSYSEMSMMCSTMEESTQLKTASQVFGVLQCNQVFLGLVSFQFKPKTDVVALIEDLQVAGIRFVHFTCENEVRGKAFALKLGLETDWNCHISLAPDVEYAMENIFSSGLGLSRSSSASSLNSVINPFMSNYRAKLPIGIKSIRPHIENVDNVPLQVPLFTDCTTDTIRDMIQILQENSEVVLCLGNAWNRENLSIFSQSDISLSLIPEYVNTSVCVETETCALSTSTSSQSTSLMSRGGVWPSPLEMAANLNSTTSQLCFNRDQDVSLLCLITESRHILSVIRHGLLYGLGSYVSVALLLLLAELFFLPPPLDGSHLFWLVFFVIPCISMSFLWTPKDPRINSQMPARKKQILSEKYLILSNFMVTFVPTIVVCSLLFGLTLSGICFNDILNSDCHILLGNRNGSSAWNGWRGESEQGLLLAQDLVSFFLCLYLSTYSFRFIHRTKPIWKLWRFLSWQYIVVLLTVVILQVIYFAASQAFATTVRKLPVISSLSSVPFYVWIIGFLWPFVLLLPQELLKWHDKTNVFKLQTRLKLDFETKLGTYSPM